MFHCRSLSVWVFDQGDLFNADFYRICSFLLCFFGFLLFRIIVLPSSSLCVQKRDNFFYFSEHPLHQYIWIANYTFLVASHMKTNCLGALSVFSRYFSSFDLCRFSFLSLSLSPALSGSLSMFLFLSLCLLPLSLSPFQPLSLWSFSHSTLLAYELIMPSSIELISNIQTRARRNSKWNKLNGRKDGLLSQFYFQVRIQNVLEVKVKCTCAHTHRFHCTLSEINEAPYKYNT